MKRGVKECTLFGRTGLWKATPQAAQGGEHGGALLGEGWQAIARAYNHAEQSCKQAREYYKATLCVI